MTRRSNVVIDATKTNKPSIAEALTLEALTERYHFHPEAIQLRVKRGKGENGNLYLWPDRLGDGDRLRQVIGLDEGRMVIYSPVAYTLIEGDTGSWLVRRGPRIIVAVPHPAKLREMEQAGLIKTEAVNLPANFRFKRSGESWNAKVEGEKGPFVVPLRGFDPGFDLSNPSQSLSHDNLMMRPALTACIWVAGPKEMIEGASTEDLADIVKFDETMTGRPRFSWAEEFNLLGGWRTAFEAYGTPDMERYFGVTKEGTTYRGFVAQTKQFREDMDVMIERGERWLKHTLYALLHTDVQGTVYENVIARLLDKSDELDETTRRAIIDEVVANVSLEDVRQCFEESMREGTAALDWLKGWANWAEEDMAKRQKRRLKLLVPQPAGRPPQAGPPLVEYDSAAVAKALLDYIKAEAKRGSKTSPPSEIKMPPPPPAKELIKDETRVRRLFPQPPPATPKMPVNKVRSIAPPPKNGGLSKGPVTAKDEVVRTSGMTENGLGAANPEAAARLAAIGERLNGNNGKPIEVRCKECNRFVIVPEDWHGRMACDQHNQPKGGKKAKPHLKVPKAAPPAKQVRCPKGHLHNRPEGFRGGKLETCPSVKELTTV